MQPSGDRKRARWRPESSRIVKLPPPGPELTLRPHTTYALVLELLVAALGLFTFLDVRGADWTIAVLGLGVAFAFGIGAPLAYRRSTHVGPEGVRIQGALSSRFLDWDEIDGFELLAHRPGRADRIAARTTSGEVVRLIHQDAKALSMRPEVARTFYTGLIERLDTVRRTAGR